MNKPDFTPGPWLTGDKTKNNYSSCRVFAKKNNFFVCVAATDQELDANLIAAAPDMYAALEACDEAMAYMSEYDIPITLPNQVKAALAKARGENENS